jgi:hypothetical protein
MTLHPYTLGLLNCKYEERCQAYIRRQIMARLNRSARVLQSAEAALMSAIEIYNKPAFAYREERFAILALNVWELLLNAKLLEVSKNKLLCLNICATKEEVCRASELRI